MTSFNNSKLLLLFIFFTGGFQYIQPFCCCNTDTTVNTRLKPSQTGNTSNLSVAAAINQNQENNKRITSFQKSNQDNSQKSTSLSKTTSCKPSDLATIMAQHELNKKKIAKHQAKTSQNNSLNSQTLIAQSNATASPGDIKTTTEQYQASKNQPYTNNASNQYISSQQPIPTYSPTNESSNQISLPITTTRKAFSSEETHIQHGHNIVLGRSSSSINNHMPELILPPPAIQSENKSDTTQNNYLMTPVAEDNTPIEHVAENKRSPNNAHRELPSYATSPRESINSPNNNLPNAIAENFN